MTVLALVVTIVLAQADMGPAAPASVEGRPPAVRLSPIQRRIDDARPGDVVVVEPGTYEGDVFIDRSVRLVGRGRPLLVGSGAGTVVLIRAANVVVEGFDIDGRGGGDLGSDSSGIHAAAPDVTIRDCRIANTLFGIYLREAHRARIEKSRIRGIRGKAAGEKGSGIHVWNTDGFTLVDNDIADVRDGLYIQSSPHGFIARNVARDLRYGLHYMYSDDNVFEENRFENGDAGTAIMYSRRLVFRRNQFLRNRGFASVGLLLKSCDDVVAEQNLIADNARGIFLEGTDRTLVRANVVAGSDVAIVLFGSAMRARFLGNSFVANLAPLSLAGRATDARFAGNYWSDHRIPDLDGDGRADRAYRLSNLFDHLRGNLTAADLMSRSLASSAVGAAELAFPVLAPVPVVDETPLARPPQLDVPQPAASDATVANVRAVVVPLAALLLGLAGLLRGARPVPWHPGARAVSA